MQNTLKVGDTIQCASDLDMIYTSEALAKEGVFTDWLDVQKPGKERYKLTVMQIVKARKKNGSA